MLAARAGQTDSAIRASGTARAIASRLPLFSSSRASEYSLSGSHFTVSSGRPNRCPTSCSHPSRPRRRPSPAWRRRGAIRCVQCVFIEAMTVLRVPGSISFDDVYLALRGRRRRRRCARYIAGADAAHRRSVCGRAIGQGARAIDSGRIAQPAAAMGRRGRGSVSTDTAVKARHTLAFGDVVEITPQPAPDAAAYTPEPMPLDVVFEDDAILVLNKPPKLVVHPAAGHWSGTLLNGLLAYSPALSEVPRAGIVHRLDADTSGLMVVAKTLAAQTDLVRQLQARTVRASTGLWCSACRAARGTIDAAIGRDPRNPLRFKSQHDRIREACPHALRMDRFDPCGGGRNFLARVPAGNGSNASDSRAPRASWPSADW